MLVANGGAKRAEIAEMEHDEVRTRKPSNEPPPVLRPEHNWALHASMINWVRIYQKRKSISHVHHQNWGEY
jgi:hypothetical protein